MKKLLYTAIAATIAMTATLSTTSCVDSGNNNSDTIAPDSTVTESLPEVDSTAMQEVTGIVADAAQRSIDLQVGDTTLNFVLDESLDNVSCEIGDSLTIRYYMTRQNGDSVVQVINH